MEEAPVHATTNDEAVGNPSPTPVDSSAYLLEDAQRHENPHHDHPQQQHRRRRRTTTWLGRLFVVHRGGGGRKAGVRKEERSMSEEEGGSESHYVIAPTPSGVMPVQNSAVVDEEKNEGTPFLKEGENPHPVPEVHTGDVSPIVTTVTVKIPTEDITNDRNKRRKFLNTAPTRRRSSSSRSRQSSSPRSTVSVNHMDSWTAGVSERLQDFRDRSRLDAALRYNATHPIEQPLIAFPLSALFGICLKRLLVLGNLVHVDPQGGSLTMKNMLGALLWHVLSLGGIWLLQERLCVQSFEMEDPLVSVTEQSSALSATELSSRTIKTATTSHVLIDPCDGSSPVPPSHHPSTDLLQRTEQLHEGHVRDDLHAVATEPSLNDSKDDGDDHLYDFWSFSGCVQTPITPRRFSPDQVNAIETLASRYFNVNRTDQWARSRYLCVNDDPWNGAIRALDARRWNLNDASALIEGNLSWREREDIDNIFSLEISESDLESIRTRLGDGLFGLDKAGHPLWMCAAGDVDLNALKAEVPLTTLLVYHLQCLEFNQRVWFKEITLRNRRLRSSSSQHPAHQQIQHPVYQMTILLDLKHFGLHTVKGAFWECLHLIGDPDKDYYYENVHQVLIVNAPSFFRFFWRTLGPLFDPDTRAKFKVLRRVEDLAEYVDLRVVPQELGGRYNQHKRPRILNGGGRDGGSVYSQHFDAFLRDYRLRRRIEQGVAPRRDLIPSSTSFTSGLGDNDEVERIAEVEHEVQEAIQS